MEKDVLTRREFLKTTSSAALAGALFLKSPEELLAKTDKKTRVILIRDKNVLDADNNVSEEILPKMMDTALTTLLDLDDPAEAWKQLIKPDDVVGIKTNIWSYLPTPAALNKIIEKRVMEAGVPEKKISVRDRGLLEDDVFLKASALINVRPLRTHHWSGVGSLIKNYITFVPDPWAYHDDSCADLAKLWKLPIAEGKTRLNILVVLTPLFHGIGPHHFSAEHTWAYKGLLVGFDPVALDATGVRLLMEKRREFFEEDRPLNPPPKHVFLADTRHKLGTAEPNKIDLVKIGWEDDILI